MLEILSPAGSAETVIAAVQNGADAIYMGFGDYNARRNAKNFTEDELKNAVEYCRIRGVKTHVTMNTLLSDREIPAAIEQARIACRAGVDALIVQDLGMVQTLRRTLPDMELHGSTQMSVHNLEGVKIAAAMGLKRVVLARELNREEIAYICQNSPIEIEVFVHGALCMCYSGQCYMSAVIGRRSGNRGLCAQPCRQRYDTGIHNCQYPLSLKDNCLVSYLEELEQMGVASVKIEGRMRRPEYAAIVTGIYSRAAKQHQSPSADDMRMLTAAFSRQGFTDGYYRDLKGPDMFGIRTEEDKKEQPIFSSAKKSYLNGEYQRIPVRFVAQVKAGESAKLVAIDDSGNSAATEGQIPEKAFNRELTEAVLKTQLHKTGGTPFICEGVKCRVEPGLSMATSSINEMRRAVLVELMQKRRLLSPRREEDFIPLPQLPNPSIPVKYTLSFLKAAQLTPAIADMSPDYVYLPAEEYENAEDALLPFRANPAIHLGVTLPRIIHDNERATVLALLKKAHAMGATDALCGNIGHLLLAREAGLQIHGDYGLNVFNSESLQVLKNLGLLSATLSFELRLQQIRDISKCLDTEILVYGRLPLMITENCLIRASQGVCCCDSFRGITDKTGACFPVLREFGCRNTLYNSQKLFMADKMQDVESLGLWGVRLNFTTENAQECVAVLQHFMGRPGVAPAGCTRGLYYRGVE